ncbi:hypothetical protein GGR54DRAFT_239257 [Hypoxylon sp. NC1633]|nr:hypothetical protein GGR54DRAFT_239257 [Hypoxylon sp. NC1633]
MTMSLGPLTTSFTPPADCLTSTAIYWVNTASTFYWLHGQPMQSSCFPDNYSPYQNQYYSPGVCPDGYTKACESQTTSGASFTATHATCCPRGNFVCAQTSDSYSYPWGPTLGCQSVFRASTEIAFIKIDGTPSGGETPGTPRKLAPPGTVMAYGVAIQNSATTTTTTATTSDSSTSQTQTHTSDPIVASETATAQADGTSSGGIGAGGAAGIGIAAAVGIAGLSGAILWMIWSRRQEMRRRRATEQESQWSWSSSTAMSPCQPFVQVNSVPMELPNRSEPKEMPAESLGPAEKDGRGIYWHSSSKGFHKIASRDSNET